MTWLCMYGFIVVQIMSGNRYVNFELNNVNILVNAIIKEENGFLQNNHMSSTLKHSPLFKKTSQNS